MIPTLWYKNAVVYCLSVGSYMDANGDGVGDFEGLIRRLDYLHGLGVTAVWLMPFHPSPQKDHGYDVTDYYGVDPRYGSLGDFVEFTHGCKQRGMRVIMDLVVNHTSDQHPWFQAARRDPASPYRDWYLWSKTKPRGAHKGMVFPGFQDATWDYDDAANAWYFHRFYKFQPDLNMANPDVRAEILRVIGFWIELGVSGFRMDAVPFIIDQEHPGRQQPKPDYGMLREFREFAQWRQGDCVLLAEANVPPPQSAEYFGRDGDRLHMMFNFPVNQAHFYALAAEDTRPLIQALKATQHRPDTAQWCHFLRNHDELDLSGLSDEQRAAVFDVMAPDPDMRLYDRGIRRRLPPMVQGDRRRVELATSLLLSLPGTPVIRYGDEIGMGDNLALPQREAVRTPMQWDDTPNAGFSQNDDLPNPVIDAGPYGFQHINVSAQRRDPMSLLNWTERMIRLRQEAPEIGNGRYQVLRTPPGTLVLRYDWRTVTVIIVHNFRGAPCSVTLRGRDVEAMSEELFSLLDDRHERADSEGAFEVLLEGYGYRWFRAGRRDEAITQRLKGRTVRKPAASRKRSA